MRSGNRDVAQALVRAAPGLSALFERQRMSRRGALGSSTELVATKKRRHECPRHVGGAASRSACATLLLLSSTMLLQGDLPRTVQHIPSGPAISALFRGVPMPGGEVPILRPPAETRPALTSLIAAAPRDAMLYRLRAQQAETALDFTAAEADWKLYAQHASDRYAGQIELADFYHRRIRPRDELTTLNAASGAKDDPLQQVQAQPGWRAFERMAALIESEDLGPTDADPVFRAWVARYPKEPAAWRRRIEYLGATRQFGAAEAEIAAYGRAFQNEVEPVRMRAELAIHRGDPAAAIRIYDAAFQPLWPDEMRASYFKLLEEQGRLRDFTAKARTALASNPADLDATARLFHYFRAQNNVAAARRTLLEYRIAKESGPRPWTAAELETAAQLFEWLPDVNEAARLYYALYSAPPAGGPHTERAIYSLANLLLTAPEQPIQFGAGDLSFYKDIATIDPSPGFLNGILSLLLNWTGARSEYRVQNEKSAAYFHRAAASQLVALLEQRFPRSEHREPLRASLVSAYARYGDEESVIRAARAYLADFPNGGARLQVTMLAADALARGNRSTEEFALYDQLLKELGARAGGVPVGNQPPFPVPEPVRGIGVQSQPAGPRSTAYVQVLDRYLARLEALGRPLDELRLYRAEIDRNPNDEGLYERLANFVEQHGVARDVETVYTQAIAKFADRSWYHKLARWYLRRQEYAAFDKISRDVIAIFSGSELEGYFRELVTNRPDAVLYRQLNLYAQERFPEDLVFVHNLLSAYSDPATRDVAAAERLLRQYWFYDEELRTRLFEQLAARGQLELELGQVRAANPGLANGHFEQALAANPAAVQFVAEAEAWLSHFEQAAPAVRALARAYPGRRDFTIQAASLYRSLAAYDPRNTEVAVAMATDEQKSAPRDAAILARIGDTLADRELFTRARTYWDRMPLAEPAKPAAWLDTATVYWDYYRYNDALRWIAAARKKFGDASLFAYQAGAIYEGKRDYPDAVREYVAGALHGEGSCSTRLIRLLSRAPVHDLVDRATAQAVAAKPSQQAVALRVSVLETGQRRQDLEALLTARVEAETSPAGLANLQETARRLGFVRIEERASERMVPLTNDPVDRMRLTLANVRLYEGKKEIAQAARVVDALYRDHPLILGVVRGAVDFHVRNRQYTEAIAELMDASRHARADLSAQFTLEAARDATEAGQFDRARTLLGGLLSTDPLQAEYLTAMGDTYLRAKDDTGFRDYQLATIQQLQRSKLSPAERLERIATIRRSLIPALDRLKDYAGAVDQYIEVVNRYPEDEALTKEAAAYAVAHGEAARLVTFYRKTMGDAPLDYRWPIVLGRIETATEDFPAAIADYERGIKARPDRADVLEAKAGLEEKLMRFDDAIKSYGRLYELAYRNPQWMIKVAELDARTGKKQDAVRALKTAIIGARTETADADLAIAEQLESWHLIPEAVSFAEQAARIGGADMFQTEDPVMLSRLSVYKRILARGRRIDGPFLKALAPKASMDAEAMDTAGRVVAETYTPEEMARLERALIDDAGRTTGGVPEHLSSFVRSAGMADLEARWLREPLNEENKERLVALESQRGRFAELGRMLEEYSGKNAGQAGEAWAFTQSIQAFIHEGDVEGQMRVMRTALARSSLSGPLLDRYLNLLIARQPEELLALARSGVSSDVRNRAVQVAIASERADLAYRAIGTRGGAGLPPVWARAYTALAGMYLDDRAPVIDAAFQGALDTRTIGERLQAPLKPDSVIVGHVWFYYGARYGEYLGTAKNDRAADWLASSLEGAPESPAAYMALGDWYAQAGQGAKAIGEYDAALQLDDDRADAHDHAARVLWDEGRQVEAVARWKAALATYLRIQSRGVRVPEPFWHWAAETFLDIGKRHALGQIRIEIAHLLGDYYQRNNIYRFNELLEPAASASIASGEGMDWLVELSRSMEYPDSIVFALSRAPGITAAQQLELQRVRVDLAVREADRQFGDAHEAALSRVEAERIRLAAMLLDAGDARGAAAEWRLVPPPPAKPSWWTENRERYITEVRLASRTGTLDALLARYPAEARSMNLAETLRFAAVALRKEHDEEGARKVLEFVYDRAIHEGHLEAANFLGLAEVKLQRGDTAAAVALLNRMSLVSYRTAFRTQWDDGVETLPLAAELLVRYGKSAEAADFLRRRLKAVPWDADAKLHLARLLLPANAERAQVLDDAINNSQAAYRLRAEAARMAAGRSSAAPAGTELSLLASPSVSPAAAAKPFQVEARVEAARETYDAGTKLRLWQEALAIAPEDLRVRLGTLRAAIAAGRDSLALALEPGPGPMRYGRPYSPPKAGELTDDERASVAEALAGAAERLDDLVAAQSHLRAAIELRPPDQRQALMRRLDAITAEQDRRAKNTSRQPAVRNVIEQDHAVGPRIPRSAQ